jgi:hypothetical protein
MICSCRGWYFRESIFFYFISGAYGSSTAFVIPYPLQRGTRERAEVVVGESTNNGRREEMN